MISIPLSSLIMGMTLCASFGFILSMTIRHFRDRAKYLKAEREAEEMMRHVDAMFEAMREHRQQSQRPSPMAIPMAVKWKWQEADGSACHHCGEPAFGRMLRLNLAVGKTNRLTPQELFLCSSCGECAQPPKMP